ncbi:MAG: hypothetical protein DRZ90_12120 [Spirochaetes bacterium]|nr:MAG: hypothetical protein DRZ90_12120 [Spirochaetota bacterium]
MLKAGFPARICGPAPCGRSWSAPPGGGRSRSGDLLYRAAEARGATEATAKVEVILQRESSLAGAVVKLTKVYCLHAFNFGLLNIC